MTEETDEKGSKPKLTLRVSKSPAAATPPAPAKPVKSGSARPVQSPSKPPVKTLKPTGKSLQAQARALQAETPKGRDGLRPSAGRPGTAKLAVGGAPARATTVDLGPQPAHGGEVRIIAGTWRGRKLKVLPMAELRPTPDRVRETVFNWLQGELIGARVLDLCAGTGALGIEAASRGASQVTLVERDRLLVAELRRVLLDLKATQVTVVQADALPWLAQSPQPYDLVFLDPPFAARDLHSHLIAAVVRGWLTPKARIYLEWNARLAPPVPNYFRVYRQARAGQVGFGLFTVDAL